MPDSSRPQQTRVADSLDAALRDWEAHERPGLPVDGFVLGRRPKRYRTGLYRVDGTTVIEPEGHLLRITPAPNRRRIAVEWAPRADENAVLGIVDAEREELRLHERIGVRHDPVLWSADSSRLEVAASRERAIIELDVVSGRSTRTPVAGVERVRLLPGGAEGLLARRPDGGPTELIDRSTGASVGRYGAVHRTAICDEGFVVWHDRGIDRFTDRGAHRWSWHEPGLRITDLASSGDGILALGASDGRSVVVGLSDGASREIREIAAGHGPAAATGIAMTDHGPVVRVEAPLVPPRVIPLTEATAPFTDAEPAPGTEEGPRTSTLTVRADDGTEITVILALPHDRTGPIPVILTCYGGFGVPALPEFEPTIPAWVDHGGGYAIAQIRGGGERGNEWWWAGSGARKQRAVDDLAAVAAGLCAAGISRPELLVLAGASHGGCIAAACGLEHPGSFSGIAVTAAPLDLLALDAHPLGRLWRDEFGDDGTAESRERLRRLSPLERARRLRPDQPVPAFLGIVLAEDTRVAPDDTRRVVDALRGHGARAELWEARGAGHGANHLDALHAIGSRILAFAARTTGLAEA